MDGVTQEVKATDRDRPQSWLQPGGEQQKVIVFLREPKPGQVKPKRSWSPHSPIYCGRIASLGTSRAASLSIRNR